MKIGIDKISFDVSDKYIDIKDLAKARNVEVEKYTIGIGQEKMSITDKSKDVVTLAYHAAKDMLDKNDIEKIDLVIFATESSIDQSKAAGIFLKEALKIKNESKFFEVKQACFGASAALDIAKGHIVFHPDSKVLILASDISKYGINSPGEVTQGAGAVAILVSKDPSLLEFNNDETYITKDIMDFWRPNYSKLAFVDGKYSVSMYLDLLNNCYENFEKKDLKAFCLHLPYYKMGLKGLKSITDDEKLINEFNNATIINKQVGNIYTGSVYLSLISLLVYSKDLNSGDNIGIFSYGSGASAELFSLKLISKNIDKKIVEEKLNRRKKITIEEYEKIFFEEIEIKDGNAKIKSDDTSFRLKEIKDHKRIYGDGDNE